MRIALDSCVGHMGAAVLCAGGHEIVTVAEEGEQDRVWFARAIANGAEVVIAADVDLEILCYDHRVTFFQHRQGERGVAVAERFVAAHVEQ